MFFPAMMCAGYGPPETSDSQAAYTFLKTTVTVLPLPPLTLLMSSYPVRLMTLNAGLMNTCHVALKSAAVTSLPSLHSASGLYVKRTVSGLFLISCGLPVHRRGTQAAEAFRIWHPYQMLLVTRLVAYRLLP